MSNPSPLVPQGSIQEAPKGRRNLPVLVFSVIGFHVAVLGVGLMIGCKPETTKTADPLDALAPTNTLGSTFDSGFAPTNEIPPLSNPYSLPAGPAPAPGSPLATTPVTAPADGLAAPGTAYAPMDPLGTTPGTAPVPVPVPVPSSGYGSPVPSYAETVVPAVEPASTGGVEHKVKSGESFSTIAKNYGVTVKAVQDANPGVDARRLQIGQTIRIPATTRSAAVSSGAPATTSGARKTGTGSYTVKAGDSLTKIAKSHGTSVKALKSLNGLKTDRINVGQKLKVPVKAAAEPAPEPAPAIIEPAPQAPATSPTFGTLPPPTTVPVPAPGR